MAGDAGEVGQAASGGTVATGRVAVVGPVLLPPASDAPHAAQKLLVLAFVVPQRGHRTLPATSFITDPLPAFHRKHTAMGSSG